MSNNSVDNLLLLGKVIRPHGSKGLLRIWSCAVSETSFLNSKTVFLKSISGEVFEYSVDSVVPHKNVLLIKLKGLSFRDELEKLCGAEIYIRKEELSREEDEYFWYELLGLDVFLDTGGYLGRVSQIIPTGSNDIYIVKKMEKEVLLPATDEVIKEIDLKKRKIIISTMEGLLELNEI